MNLQIAICDDILPFCRKLKSLLQTALKPLTASAIDIYTDGNSFLEHSFQTTYQLIFMDIELQSELNGIKISELFRKKNPRSEIVFVSSKTQYALELFQLYPFDFLVKPIQAKDVQLLIQKYLAKYPENNLFHYQNQDFNIAYQDIYAFEFYQKEVTIHSNQKPVTFRLYEPFQQFCEVMQPYGFAQIHQSYCINCAQIADFHKDKVTLKNGMEYKLSRTYQEEFFLQYLGVNSDD